MDRLTAANVFVTIVERGSLVAAANALAMSRSMVTRYLAEMEDWSGSRLLHRSTRSLSLTPAGEQVLSHCHRLLELASEVPAVDHGMAMPRGLLRIGCSQFVAHQILAPVVRQYLASYPEASVNLHVSSQTVDLIAERIDLTIRITNELDPGLIARRLGRCDSVICAAPAYLASRPSLNSPEDLTLHNCLSYSYFGDALWQFEREGRSFKVPVRGNFSANDSMVVLEAALAGEGVAMQPVLAAQPYLDSGQLQLLLPDYRPQSLGIYGVYQSRKHLPPALRLMLDSLVAHFAAQ
ncbi:LysR family transcriptional regulator [Shewanella sp. AS16]|uniref:LysR family transcriptional regulator n=1 Tax=Shewanella sp. AS16 TaxID=2907625 RepID=UPI001F2F386A|nr:LysR family transcriptional regulator [Shewanella sp. AS16]MCE9685356.1 LysR family transcriptional regulator [Shewanella sp. AS16]